MKIYIASQPGALSLFFRTLYVFNCIKFPHYILTAWLKTSLYIVQWCHLIDVNTTTNYIFRKAERKWVYILLPHQWQHLLIRFFHHVTHPLEPDLITSFFSSSAKLLPLLLLTSADLVSVTDSSVQTLPSINISSTPSNQISGSSIPLSSLRRYHHRQQSIWIDRQVCKYTSKLQLP